MMNKFSFSALNILLEPLCPNMNYVDEHISNNGNTHLSIFGNIYSHFPLSYFNRKKKYDLTSFLIPASLLNSKRTTMQRQFLSVHDTVIPLNFCLKFNY